LLGGGNSNIFYVHPEPWRLTPIFHRWVGLVETTKTRVEVFPTDAQSIRDPRAPQLRNPPKGGHFEGSSLPSFLHGTLLSRATGVGGTGRGLGLGGVGWWWMSPAAVGRRE